MQRLGALYQMFSLINVFCLFDCTKLKPLMGFQNVRHVDHISWHKFVMRQVAAFYTINMTLKIGFFITKI